MRVVLGGVERTARKFIRNYAIAQCGKRKAPAIRLRDQTFLSSSGEKPPSDLSRG